MATPKTFKDIAHSISLAKPPRRLRRNVQVSDYHYDRLKLAAVEADCDLADMVEYLIETLPATTEKD